MKKVRSLVISSLALVSLMGLTACSSSDDLENNGNVIYDDQGNAGVKSEFVISIPRSVVGTRMTGEVTQNLGTAAQFRGLDNIRLIPFDNVPTGSSTKLSNILGLSSISMTGLSEPGTLNYKVYADQYVPVGTKNFLFYAKAIDRDADVELTSMDDKFKYGMLHVTGLTDETFTNPNSVTFSLEQINTSADQQAGNSVGRSIVQLLTDMANTTSTGTAPHNAWSTATNIVLARLYKNFIGTTVSSSSSLASILGMIYAGLERISAIDSERPLADAIANKILSACTGTPVVGLPVNLTSDYKGYPANIGLPDGAVRVRWDAVEKKFVDMTANYNQNFKATITDYVYPAPLWYFVSTPLKASNAIQSKNYDEETSWNNVIDNVYAGSDSEVGPSTLSVALTEPVQYAVGRIETKIEMGNGPFYDGKGEVVETGTGFKLKGLLIGGQHNAAYDFSAKGDVERIIYDRVMAADINARPNVTTPANHTLALQTKSNQVVYAALELENGGKDFMGFDGVIPAGGTFYLTTVLNPQSATNYDKDKLNKIVMKDHVTKLTVNINTGNTTPDRNKDGKPDVYVFDANGYPIGVDANGDGVVDPYDIDGDGNDDVFITDSAKGGPGWDTDGDGVVDLPVLPDPTTGLYPTYPNIPGGLGNATNGIPDLSSPGIELGTSVNLEWQQGLILNPDI